MSTQQQQAPDVTMRYPQGDLAILSAETYTPGIPLPSPRSRSPVTKKAKAAPRPSEDAPRKRAKVQPAAESAGQDEEKKRTRGRPRLDVKDETAADRRRTQIRLAQRAYRNRKENAIQTLEKKVQELKDANEEMSNVFLQLHDFAVSSGALESNPDFGRQLRLTTEKFLALARQASEDNGKDDETGSNGSHRGSSSARADGAKSSSPERVETLETDKPTSQPLLYGGFTITHEPLTEADLIADFSSNLLPPPATSGLDFEIVTQPTLENASFPFGTAPEFDFGAFSNPSPYSSLPLPRTYTSQEATFGRRLHRFATERALLLISMPNPPQERFKRVFGFCLLLETREAIHQRLRRIVGRNIQENLSNWQYPFYNLGGAGTHFDADTMTDQRVGNQGTIDVLKPQHSTGYSQGPFTPDLSEVRESALDKDMRIQLSGFRGDYFDCDEVEMYLRQRGVTIPAGADFVTVEVDPAGLGANSITATTLYGTDLPSAGLNAPTTESNRNNSSMNIFASANPSGSSSSHSPASSADGGASSVTTASTQPPTTSSWNLGGISSLVDPLLSGVFSPATGSHSTYMGTTGLGADSSGNGTSVLDFTITPSTTLRRKTVMLDVNTLITKMTERGTCLGRTPGFRPADINTAFWKAARVISS